MLNFVTGAEIKGRYVVQGMVGRGGYGSVWRAADKQLNRDVALKRLFKDGIETPAEETKRLLAEARKHAQLVHANIVQVYDVVEAEGEHLIVMEFIDGPSLHSLLREQARTGKVLPLDQTVSILEDVIAGVAFAHEKGIVHRDLSPGNILLTSTMVPKLGDFGIATLKTPVLASGVHSIHGATGNRDYMAPEQHRGEEADHSSDLFMVGIIGYLLLSGKHPFAHASGLFEIPESICDETFVPEQLSAPSVLTSSQQRLFKEYAAVVMRLLRRERAGRYNSAREALASIQDVAPFQECPQCGERLPENFAYCGYCGTLVAEPPKPLVTALATITIPAFEPSVDQLIDEGFNLSRERRWDDAIARYRAALSRDGQNQRALRNLGFALNKVGRHEEAENILSRGLDLGTQVSSHEASFRFERAFARTELKRYDLALEDIHKVLDLMPVSSKALYLKARIHLYRGALPEARRDVQDLLKRDSTHMGALRMLDQLSTNASDSQRSTKG